MLFIVYRPCSFTCAVCVSSNMIRTHLKLLRCGDKNRQRCLKQQQRGLIFFFSFLLYILVFFSFVSVLFNFISVEWVSERDIFSTVNAGRGEKHGKERRIKLTKSRGCLLLIHNRWMDGFMFYSCERVSVKSLPTMLWNTLDEFISRIFCFIRESFIMRNALSWNIQDMRRREGLEWQWCRKFID